MQSTEALLVPVLGEPAAAQVDPRQAERTLGVAPGHLHEFVVDPECLGVRAHPLRHRLRQRAQHQLAEEHVVDDAAAVLLVTSGEGRGELVGPQRLE
ncbi:MAG: hypothetical protein U0W40_16395 [Acidimicrobiia bacterium]